MAFLWMPLAQNTLQVQAFSSLVKKSAGLRCEIVEEIQEIQDDSREEPSYEFEAQVSTTNFCTGPVTFVVPSEFPHLPYGMYEAEYDKAQSAWHIFVREFSHTTSTFPAMELFPDFSDSSPAISGPEPEQEPCKQSSSPSLAMEPPAGGDASAADSEETNSNISSETADPLQPSPATETSLSWAEVVEEEEEEAKEKIVTTIEETKKTWAEEMDEEDGGASTPNSQVPQPGTEAPLPPIVSTVDIFEQDDVETVIHGGDVIVKLGSSDETTFQQMVAELEDQKKPNLKAFVPEDTTEAFKHFSDKLYFDNPRNLQPDSFAWYQLCLDNAEWWHKASASAKIKRILCWSRPELQGSEINVGSKWAPTPFTQCEPNHFTPSKITHHRNMLGRCVDTPSTTPIEISFWATHSPALLYKFQQKSPLLHRVCRSLAAIWVDPFQVTARIGADDGSVHLTGSKLAAVARGKVERVYLFNDAWREPEEAKSRDNALFCVDLLTAPVKPLTPLIFGPVAEEHFMIVVNDDGRNHLPTKSKTPRNHGPSNLRHMKLCYEDVEKTIAGMESSAKQEAEITSEAVAEMFRDEVASGQADHRSESADPIVAPERAPTRRILRVRSPRMAPNVEPRAPTASNNQRPDVVEPDVEDDESEAETEIIVDTDQPTLASHYTLTRRQATRTSGHNQSGVRVSEWLETFADHPLDDAEPDHSHVVDDHAGSGVAVDEIAGEDEFLRRLSQEDPQEIITTEVDSSGDESSFENGGYSPIMPNPNSPITDSSAYDEEPGTEVQHQDRCDSSDDEDEDIPNPPIFDTAGAAISPTEATKDPETAVTDLVVYCGPITADQVLPLRIQGFTIISPAIPAQNLTLTELPRPMEITFHHKLTSNALVLYRSPFKSRRIIHTPNQRSRRSISEATTRTSQLEPRLARNLQVFYSSRLSLGRNGVTVQQEGIHKLAPQSSQAVTSTADIDPAPPSALSQADPIIHEIDVSCIPIIPFNDVSEIPTPALSAPERFYGRINIAIGRAAIKAWNFLTPSSKDWSTNMGSTGGDDGYLWDRQDIPWESFQLA